MPVSRPEEAAYFQAFLDARPDLQLELIKHEDRPDFRVRRGQSQVGVEVTRFSPERQSGMPIPEEQESLQQWTMESARSAYYKEGGTPIHVSAGFDSGLRLTKKRAPELARVIASFLLGNTRSLLVYQHSEFDEILYDAFLPELSALSAIRVAAEGDGAWITNHFAWPRHADEDDVRRVVAEKERKIGAYRQGCDEIWLLVVFDLHVGEVGVELPTPSVLFTVPTKFDRVFCLSPSGRRCVEAPLTRTG